MDDNLSHAGNNEVVLRELAIRLSTYPGDQRDRDPQLLVGQLPSDLPFDVPLPEGSLILGSLLRNAQQAEIVFDTTLPPGGVLDFYKERLLAAGWYEPTATLGPSEGGFVHTGFPGGATSLLFCQSTRGPSLTVNAFKGKAGRTDVRLTVDRSPLSSPCAQRSRSHRRMAEHDLIPPLLPPLGARQMGGGGSWSDDRVTSSASLETDEEIPILTLSAHYATLFEQAGWTRLEEGDSGPVAWHIWSFDEENEPWRGLFFVLKVPGMERAYYLYVKANWANSGETGMW